MDKSTFVLKICGLTRVADVRTAEFCGATHVGLVVEVARSARCITRQQARMLARAARACPVLVTTSEDPDHIEDLALTVEPGVVQLHGAPPDTVTALQEVLPGVQLWHAVGIEAGESPDPQEALRVMRLAAAAGAHALVLDATVGGVSGGTGSKIDWQVAAQLVQEVAPTPVILAGGLNPDNVAEAIRKVRPAGVDVSSGVETAPNVKSPHLIRAFCETVRKITRE